MKVKEFYNKLWKNKPEYELSDYRQGEFADFKSKWPILKKELKLWPDGSSVLDYGCGIGRYVGEIQKFNETFRIIGLDVSNQILRVAKKRFPKQTFIPVEPDQKLLIKSNSIDVVFAGDVIEHIFDTDLFVRELYRILKKPGVVVISTPYHGVIKNLALALLGFNIVFNVTGPHIRFFTKKSLTSLLESHGFKILKVGVYGRFYPLSKGMYCIARKT